jgi:HEPN domain-containing protein
MPRHSPESVGLWLRHAHGDLALARARLGPEVVNELLCFHAQQAAEKAIKAVLIAHDIEPPRTHSITALVDLLPSSVSRPDSLMAARALTSFAAVTRYPGQAGPVSDEDQREAVRLAEAVVGWAEGVIGATEG